MAFVIYLLFLSWCLLGCVCFHQRRIFFHKQTIDNKNNNNYNNNNVQRENKILFAGVQEIIEDDDANRMEAFEAARIVASANSLDDKRKTKIRQPKEPVKKLTVREKTGYQYADKDGEYDVPILNSSLWFRLQAVKTKEFVVGNSVISLGSEGRFKGRIEDVFVPIVCYPRFKGDVLVAVQKPITPGLVYVKARMDPEVADALESITFVVRLPKNQKTQLVSPLTPEQGADLERARQLMVTDLDPETQKIRKDEYVSVVSGLHLGKYGVVTGTKAGKLEVLLRGGFADEQATLEPEQVRYLADPPEKKIKEMTAKDAVEALMASNPKHPLLRALKKEGILNEILYTEEERQAMQASREKRFEDRKLRDEDYSSRAGGREGGARIRSIAVEPKRPLRQEVSDSSSAYSKDSTGWGSPAASSGKTLNNADSTDDWLSSYLDTNLDSFTATESGKGGSGSRQVDPEDADFDDIIENLLKDLDGGSGSGQDKKSKVPADDKNIKSKSTESFADSGDFSDWLEGIASGASKNIPAAYGKERRTSGDISGAQLESWGQGNDSQDELWSVPDPKSALGNAINGSGLSVSDLLREESLTSATTISTRSSPPTERKVWVPKNRSNVEVLPVNTPIRSKSESYGNSPSPSPSTPVTSKRKRFPDPSAPSMDQYPDFDAYIAALIQHEQRLSSSSPQEVVKPRLAENAPSTDKAVSSEQIESSESIDDSGLLDEFYSDDIKSNAQSATAPAPKFTDGTVKELKEQCRARGLMVTGTKSELQARLSA